MALNLEAVRRSDLKQGSARRGAGVLRNPEGGLSEADFSGVIGPQSVTLMLSIPVRKTGIWPVQQRTGPATLRTFFVPTVELHDEIVMELDPLPVRLRWQSTRGQRECYDLRMSRTARQNGIKDSTQR
jgi:hypothetical protein